MASNPTAHSDEQGPSRGSRVRLVVGLLLAVGAFYLIVGSMTEGGAYFYTVDEAAVQPVSDKLIRVKGKVVNGTYSVNETTNEHRFTITEKEKTMPVYYKGALPDVFKEGAEVVATGKRDEGGTLVASEVTAKCPSKYEGDGMSEQTRERMAAERPTGT